MAKTLTPWSQLDEEMESGADAASPISSELRSALAVDAAPANPPAQRWRFVNIAPLWALVPLAIAFGWLLYRAAFRTPDMPILTGWKATLMLLLLLSAAAVLINAHVQRKALLERLDASIRTGQGESVLALDGSPLSSDIQQIWKAVHSHTRQVEDQLRTVEDERQHLALELNLFEVQKKRTEQILSALPEPVLVSDSSDRLVLANAAAERLFGFQQAKAHGQTVASLLGDESLIRKVTQMRESGARAATRRMEWQHGERQFAATFTCIDVEADGRSRGTDKHGVVTVLRDVTRDREVARKKSEFVAHAAHELRTPLTSIRAYVEMLVDGEAGDEKTRREYYEVIQSSADRLGRLIDNMLNISRIEAGTVRVQKQPVSVSAIVKEVVEMMRPQAADKRIELSEEIAPLIYQVDGDRDLLHQAVLNLVSNAVKYTPEGGRVRVRMAADEAAGTLTVFVEDTGAGIPREDLPRMFEKFFRVAANAGMAKGTGLGLNLVKHIVETVHEGRMSLVSEVGKGSVFGMALPLIKK